MNAPFDFGMDLDRFHVRFGVKISIARADCQGGVNSSVCDRTVILYSLKKRRLTFLKPQTPEIRASRKLPRLGTKIGRRCGFRRDSRAALLRYPHLSPNDRVAGFATVGKPYAVARY